MKPTLISIILCLFTLTHAQQDIPISDTPKHGELKKVFKRTGRGELTSIEVLAKIAQRKDKAVPALKAFLNAGSNKDTVTDEEPNKLYAVLALEAIGTKQAYAVLAQAAATHPETEVRGTSLKAISGSYYSKVVEDSLKPNKDIVHLLLRNCDDTTYVEFCHKRIGEIAREGIKNWTGMDFGDLQAPSDSPEGGERTIKVGSEEMTIPQYREWWWKENQGKLAWNKEKAQYEIKR